MSQPLEDVEDITTYCAAVVRDRWYRLPRSMHDDVVQEAVLIAYSLHANEWNPERCASFRDYLSTYLDLRLKDWWRSYQARNGAFKIEDGQYTDPTISVDPTHDIFTGISARSEDPTIGVLADIEFAA